MLEQHEGATVVDQQQKNTNLSRNDDYLNDDYINDDYTYVII